MIKCKINLSKIPEDRQQETARGIIVEVDVAERREVDHNGNTHSIFIFNQETGTKIYLGSGKLTNFNPSLYAVQSSSQSE